MISIAIAVLASYFLGAIPFALVLTRAVSGKDIRQFGSGNIGATNVYRMLGLKYYLAVLFLDGFKGFAAARWLGVYASASVGAENSAVICGLAAVLGHVFSIFAGFRGGKGVATGAGVLLAIMPQAVAVGLAGYILVQFTTGYVSLGSITGSILVPAAVLAQWLLGGPAPGAGKIIIAAILPLFVIWTHRENITRLRAGTESKTDFLKSFRKNAGSDAAGSGGDAK